MKEKEKIVDMKIKKKQFSISIFLITFVVFGILTSIQMVILGEFIDYKNVSTSHIITVTSYWFLAAFVFAVVINYQINHRYEKPMLVFSEATGKVANGDFSVYVPPYHRSDKLDYVDMMFLNFNKMVEELGSIETLKTDFISNVSHEIKTPISVIQNYAEGLQDENLSPEQIKEYAITIKESTKKLSELVSNILRLNKMENQKIQPVTEPYNICRQLVDCALIFEDVWESKSIEFIAELEDKAMIIADSSLMEIVWNNLLSNALKFTGPGGKVILKQTSTEDEVVVSISDTGCGMSKEAMKHIFDKFYQEDSSHSREGNGLGLALALRVLELAGSTIKVKSVEGEGSTFTVIIPAASTEEIDKIKLETGDYYE